MRSGQRFLIVLMCCSGFAVPATARLSGGDATAIFDNADIDHDGRTSRAEFAAAREKQFDRLDRNHDGVVSRDDFGRLMRLRPQAVGRLDRWIAATDGNDDGKVTREDCVPRPCPCSIGPIPIMMAMSTRQN